MRFRNLAVVHCQHEIAALEQALRRRTVGDVDDHYALSGRIKAKIIRERRRQVGDLGALEGRWRGNDQLIMRGIGRRFERNIDGELLPPRITPSGRRRQRAWLRNGTRRHWDLDWLSIDADNEVARFQSRSPRAAGGAYARNQGSGRPLQPETLQSPE